MKGLADLCYNVPDMPIYGELTDGSMRTIGQSFLHHTAPRALGDISILDIGSGSGKAMTTLADVCGADVAIGYELSDIRCDIARSLMTSYAPIPRLIVRNTNVMDMRELHPDDHPTHLYMFDYAFCPSLVNHIVKLVANQPRLRTIFTMKPDAYTCTGMWKKVDRLKTSFRGSGQSATGYVLTRVTT